MSWFTDLAGKAEELLNKVDQTAGASLNTSMVSSGGEDGEQKSGGDSHQILASSAPHTPSRSVINYTTLPSSMS